MKLSYDELANVLTFCNQSILIRILSQTGKLKYHSSRMLSNFESVCNSILDKRGEIYKVGEIIPDTDIFEEFIDTRGLQDGDAFKNSIYYDKRLESIFSVNATDGSRFLISKEVGKLLLERPYEYFASISISAIINIIILPWLKDRHHYFDNLSERQLSYVDHVYHQIPSDDRIIIVWEKQKVNAVLNYLNKLFKYLEHANRMQMPHKHRRVIRKISCLILHEAINSCSQSLQQSA
jgi:hypothetical protein